MQASRPTNETREKERSRFSQTCVKYCHHYYCKMMQHFPTHLLFLLSFAFFHSSLAINIYGTYPTCAPESTFTVITLNATGFDNNNFTIQVGSQAIDTSHIVNVDNTSLSFLTPNNLVAGSYNIQVCSPSAIYNCTTVCVNNCTSPVINCTSPACNKTNGDDNSTCTETCSQVCVKLDSCVVAESLVVYNIPPILLKLQPSSITPKTYLSLFGKNFLDCGVPSIRLQSMNNVQVFPARLNSSSELVFYVDAEGLSGIITVGLDGQHFDSVSVSPITLNVARSSPPGSSDSENPDPDHDAHILH